MQSSLTILLHEVYRTFINYKAQNSSVFALVCHACFAAKNHADFSIFCSVGKDCLLSSLLTALFSFFRFDNLYCLKRFANMETETTLSLVPIAGHNGNLRRYLLMIFAHAWLFDAKMIGFTTQ